MATLAYLLLGLLEIEYNEIIVGEVCVSKHEADAIGGSGAWIAIKCERGWHIVEWRICTSGVTV